MADANAILIASVVVFAILTLFGAVYFLVYFQHPDDKWVAWFPKIVVVVGISLAIFNLLLLPLDIANKATLSTYVNLTQPQDSTLNATQLAPTNYTALNSSLPKVETSTVSYVQNEQGLIPMDQVTFAFSLITVIISLGVVPFAIFYYEGVDGSGDDPGSKGVVGQVLQGFKVTVPLALAFIIVILALYYTGQGKVNMHVEELRSSFVENMTNPLVNYCSASGVKCSASTVTYTFNASWEILVIAISVLCSWVLFAMFGGIGLFALPLDLIFDFQNRPKPISKLKYLEYKKMLGQQAKDLLVEGQQLLEMEKEVQRSSWYSLKKRNFLQLQKRFKRDALLLDYQFGAMEDAYHRGGNPLLQYFLLFCGIIGAGLAVGWFLHLIIYVLPKSVNNSPLDTFLNKLLMATSNIPFIGICVYGFLACYLILAVIKGVNTLGMRFLFIEVHPLRVGETMMNSLVFNTGVVLLSSLAATQFCSFSFSDYAAISTSYVIFSIQLNYISFTKTLFTAFYFVYAIAITLGLLYYLYLSKKRSREKKQNSFL